MTTYRTPGFTLTYHPPCPDTAEDELWVWRLQEGPLGRRLVSSTIGFGLLPPDTVLTTWCLSGDAVRE